MKSILRSLQDLFNVEGFTLLGGGSKVLNWLRAYGGKVVPRTRSRRYTLQPLLYHGHNTALLSGNSLIALTLPRYQDCILLDLSDQYPTELR